MYKKLKSILSMTLALAIMLAPIPVQVETLPGAGIAPVVEGLDLTGVKPEDFQETGEIYTYEGEEYPLYALTIAEGVTTYFIYTDDQYVQVEIDPSLYPGLTPEGSEDGDIGDGTDDPVVDDPIVDDPNGDDPFVDDPIVDDPIVDDPLVDDPLVDDPLVDDPVIEDEYEEVDVDLDGDDVPDVKGVIIDNVIMIPYGNGYVTVDEYKALIQEEEPTLVDISGAEVVLDAQKVLMNQGEGAEYSVTVLSITLEDGTEIALENVTVTGDKADQAGEHTVEVTGIEENGYTGTASASWVLAELIDMSAAAAEASELTYTGAGQTPVFTVTLGEETLTEGEDFSVEVEAQTEVGDYAAVIKGKGEYTGAVDAAWAIKAYELTVTADMIVELPDASKIYDTTVDVEADDAFDALTVSTGVNGEEIEIAVTGVVYDVKDAGTRTLLVTIGDGIGAANYTVANVGETIELVNGEEIKIDPLTVTVTGDMLYKAFADAGYKLEIEYDEDYKTPYPTLTVTVEETGEPLKLAVKRMHLPNFIVGTKELSVDIADVEANGLNNYVLANENVVFSSDDVSVKEKQYDVTEAFMKAFKVEKTYDGTTDAVAGVDFEQEIVVERRTNRGGRDKINVEIVSVKYDSAAAGTTKAEVVLKHDNKNYKITIDGVTFAANEETTIVVDNAKNVVINPAELEIDQDVLFELGFHADKVYDATTDVPVQTLEELAGVAGETVALTIEDAQYTAADVGTQTATVELTHADANYVLVYDDEAYEAGETVEVAVDSAEHVIITEKKVVVNQATLIDAGFHVEKIYDSTTAATAGDHYKALDKVPTGVMILNEKNELVDEGLQLTIDKVEYEAAEVGTKIAYVDFHFTDKNYEIELGGDNFLAADEAGQITVEDEEHVIIKLRELSVNWDEITKALDDLGWLKKIYDNTSSVREDGDEQVFVLTKAMIENTAENDIVDGEGAIVSIAIADNYDVKDAGAAKLNVVIALVDELNYLFAETAVLEKDIDAVIAPRAVEYSGSFWRYYGQTDDYLRNSEDKIVGWDIEYAFDETGLNETEKAALTKQLEALKTPDETNNEKGDADETTTLTEGVLTYVEEAEGAKLANFDLTGGVEVEIRAYELTVALIITGMKANEAEGEGWFVGTDVVNVAAENFSISTDSAVVGEWKASWDFASEEELKDASVAPATVTERSVYLRDEVEGDNFGAITVEQIASYYNDNAYDGEVTLAFTNPIGGEGNDGKLTTRTTNVTVTVGEEGYIWLNDSSRNEAPFTALPEILEGVYALKDGNEEVIKSSKDYEPGEILSSIETEEGTKSVSNAGFKVDSTLKYVVTDNAGNMVYGEHEVVPFVPMPITFTYTDYQKDAAEDIYHIDAEGSIVVNAQPNELIHIVHVIDSQTKKDFVAMTDSDGIYTYEMDESFKRDSGSGHGVQTFTVEYVDKEQLNTDGTAASTSFVYDTVAIGVISIEWKNRDPEMKVTLAEAGTIQSIEVGGATIPVDENNGHGIAGQTLVFSDINLEEMNLPVLNPKVTIVFKDLFEDHPSVTSEFTGDNHYGIAIDAVLEPALLDNGYFDARKGKTLNLKIYGNEYERVDITVGVAGDRVKLSGDGEWDDGIQGTIDTEIGMGGQPENTALTCLIEYVDILGPSFMTTLYYDAECEQPIVTSPIFEEMMVLTGITEKHSAVYVVYQGETYKGTVDRNGYFEVEMPMLFAGDTFELHAVDIAYNHVYKVYDIPAKDMVEAKAYPMGDMVAREERHDDDRDWFIQTEIDLDNFTELTVPILAGNSFEIGTCTYTIENGELFQTLSFVGDEESVIINGVKTAILEERGDSRTDLTLNTQNLSDSGVIMDELNGATGKVYVVTQIDCVLDIGYCMETYQSDPDNHAKFTALQH